MPNRNSRFSSNTAQQRGRLAHHFVSLRKSHVGYADLQMFTQDVQAGLMLYPRAAEGGKLSVSMGNDPAAIELLKSLTNGDGYSKEQVVCDAVDEVGRQLSWNGRAIYQLIPDETNIRLVSCTPERLHKLAGYYFQHVPEADREDFPSRLIVVPKAEVWDVWMPDQLGGTKGYLRILKALGRHKGTFPQFVMDDLDAHQTYRSFQSSEYIRYKRGVRARLTASWGWNGRDTTLDYGTEFFSFYRTITFCWAQAILREHIIAEMNLLLNRLRINSQIALHGIPTSESILEIRGKMIDGDISFEEAFEATSLFDWKNRQ